MDEWFPIKNNSASSTIPPFSAVRPMGFDTTTGAVVVDKPNEDSQVGLITTGEGSTLPSGFSKGTYSNKAIVGYDTADTLAFNDTLGAVSGSYKLKKGKYGWRYSGGAFMGIANFVRSGLSATDVQGMTPGAGDCGFVAEYMNYSGLFMTILSKGGMCSCIAAGQKILLSKIAEGEFVSVESGPWDWTFSSCLEQFSVRFLALGCGPPCLELTQKVGGSGGPLTYKLYFSSCDPVTKSVIFAGSGIRYCDGDASTCSTVDDTFRVKISCASVCVCDGVYPVPAVISGTFIGGDCSVCIGDGQTYSLAYTGDDPPTSPQWEYKSAPGCGPFASGLLAYGIQIASTLCPPTTFNMFLIKPDGDFVTIGGTLVSEQCNPLAVVFDLAYVDNGALADLNALCPGGKPTQVILTA